MTKKIIGLTAALMMALSLSLTAFADDEIEYYDEYDDYYEFEQDYYDTVVFPEEEKEPRYELISPVPPAIGILAGAAAVAVLYRNHVSLARKAPKPHRDTVKATHTINERYYKND